LPDCTEKVLLASSAVFGGLTFLLPSAITIYTYVTRWIPEAPPEEQKRLKIVLACSILAGLAVVGGGIWYLKREKCI
jgi:predicted lysophospholipase L1 biosynthesis ABC-type transport system permease subunit